MSGRRVEATAPARVALAGGALEGLAARARPAGALALQVAIDRRAWCSVETGLEGVELESKDEVRTARGRTLAELVASGPPSLAARALLALGVETGVRVATQAKLPASAGLGSEPALAVALVGALAEALGRVLAPEATASLARAALVGEAGPDAALHGGVLCLHLSGGASRVERLAVDPAKVEESLLLVDAGGAPSTAGDRLAAEDDEPDGGARVGDGLAAIARVAGQAREALLAGRFEDLVGLLNDEWEARRSLGAGWTTPAIERVAGIVREAGGAASACGTGGGGIVAVWAPPGGRAAGRREAVSAALKGAGLRLFPARVDLLGLDVEPSA